MSVEILKNLLPSKIRKDIGSKYRQCVIEYKFNLLNKGYKKNINNLRRKDVIKIAFLLVHRSVWKLEQLYFLLQSDPRFEPVIFICPFKTHGERIMKEEMESSYEYFIKRKYEVVKTLEGDGPLFNVKDCFQPDIVFFTTPWEHSYPQYFISNFFDTLTCYVPYGFKNSNLYKFHFNKDVQNYCWKFFLETEIHKKLSIKHSPTKDKNVMVAGYPGMDVLLDKTYRPARVWKAQEKEKKKIIWAPHHTIPGHYLPIEYATFLEYAHLMLELAEKYQDKIQIAFKPHPILRGKLNILEDWGEEKTSTYYEKWNNLPNGQLEEGNYIDLFLGSDAMIHDSSSFLIEYLYTYNPVLYLINNEKSRQQYNEIGKMALEKIDLGFSGKDIVRFIEKTILEGKDTRKEDREGFFNKFIKPPNDQSASENIYHYLIKELSLNGRK